MAQAQDKPPKVSLNLDTLDREGASDPFCVVLDGHPYVLADPQELEWGILLSVASNPALFVRAAVPLKDADKFEQAVNRMPAWKVNKLADGYREHYGLPAPPEAAASPA